MNRFDRLNGFDGDNGFNRLNWFNWLDRFHRLDRLLWGNLFNSGFADGTGCYFLHLFRNLLLD